MYIHIYIYIHIYFIRRMIQTEKATYRDQLHKTFRLKNYGILSSKAYSTCMLVGKYDYYLLVVDRSSLPG